MKWLSWSRWPIKLFTILMPIIVSAQQGRMSSGLTIDDIIRTAVQRSETFLSLDRSIQALESDIRSRDLELSPKLSSELAQLRDHRESLSTTRSSDSRFIDVSLSKPFSTGTTLTLTAGQDASETNTYGNQNTAEWEVRLSQSLWRNSLGRSVSLRRKSDDFELRGRRMQTEYQKQTYLIDLETLYWDLSLALKEEQIRVDNIERSEQLQKWVRDRLRRSAAESSDLLQVQALSSDRKLLLLSARNRIAELRNRLQQAIPSLDARNLQVDLKSLETDRPLNSLVIGAPNGSDPKRLDALSNRYLAQEAKIEAERTSDSLSPLLDAYISHGRNGIDPNLDRSWSQAAGPDYTATQVGILFSMDLDLRLKGEKRQASRLQAESQNLLANALERTSSLGWSDLKRMVESLRTQAVEAKRLAEIQERKSREEQRRYRLGRTTAFQAITFEVDASEAELRHYRLLAEARKAEARARVYSYMEGD